MRAAFFCAHKVALSGPLLAREALVPFWKRIRSLLHIVSFQDQKKTRRLPQSGVPFCRRAVLHGAIRGCAMARIMVQSKKDARGMLRAACPPADMIRVAGKRRKTHAAGKTTKGTDGPARPTWE